jgi:drug/metabolite transporter (DMT)-like permease
MTWFFAALLAPFFFAITNHIDKYLLTHYSAEYGVGGLILVSSLFGLLVLPILLILNPMILAVTTLQAGVMVLSGMLAILGMLVHLYALKIDEASIVVPLFQTIPVYVFILGYCVLGETLSGMQILGSLLIISGGVGISLNIDTKIPRLKRSVFLLMMLSSFIFALNGLIFKIIAVETDYWTTTFWEFVGNALIGVILLGAVPQYRVEFYKLINESSRPVLGINFLNEVLNTLGFFCLRFASLLAPLALVWSVSGTQPFFVLALGVFLTLFFPRFGEESLLRRHLVQKSLGILVIVLGGILLNLSS